MLEAGDKGVFMAERTDDDGRFEARPVSDPDIVVRVAQRLAGRDGARLAAQAPHARIRPYPVASAPATAASTEPDGETAARDASTPGIGSVVPTAADVRRSRALSLARSRMVRMAPTTPQGRRTARREAAAPPAFSSRARQLRFKLFEGDTVAELLRSVTADEREIDLLTDALGQTEGAVGGELVIVADENEEGIFVAAMSLDIAGGDTLAVALQPDASHATVWTNRHVVLPGPATAVADDAVADRGVAGKEEDERVLTAIEIPPGGTLMAGLLRLGIDRAEADAAVDALRSVFDPRRIRAGQIVEVWRDGSGLASVAMSHEPGRKVVVDRSGGGYAASRIELPLERRVDVATGRIDSSLYQAAVESGVPLPVLADMIRAYSFDVDFQREIRAGDRFALMYESFVDGGGEPVRHGHPVYMALSLSGVALPAYRFVPESGYADYFNDKGESIRKALLRTPVDGARITSKYGMRTLFGYTRMHKGLDFGVPTGTPVVAAGNGVVEYIGWNGSYGNYIRLRHNGTYKTAYAHLHGFATGLKHGSRVHQGQTIGYVGNTGRSTGPHLHYEVLVNNRHINPLDVRLPAGEILAGDELVRFYGERDALDAQFERHMVMRSAALGG